MPILGRAMFPHLPATRVLPAVAGMVALLALLPAAACAQLVGTKGGGPLSPALEELAEPAVAAEPLVAQARHLGLPADGPGSLLREGGRVLVALRLSRSTEAALPALRA